MGSDPVQPYLNDLPLGGVRYFPQLGSTMDEAFTWAESGAPDLSLVLADQQTAGRGRLNRRWMTLPGAALAFSLIVRPTPAELEVLARFPAWGACSLTTAFDELGLRPEIKWPNDILLERSKVAGILVESRWQQGTVNAVVIGIGINVTPSAVPPAADVRFPASSVESVLGRPLDRWALLRSLLGAMLSWRPALPTPEFIRFWESRLAFRQEWVIIADGLSPGRQGRVLGLSADGCLRLKDPRGEEFQVQIGEVSLRPAATITSPEYPNRSSQ